MREPYYEFINEAAREDGAKILVTAGMHGNEITGIIMAFRMIHGLEVGYLFDDDYKTYENIRKITIVPVINNSGMRDDNMYDTTGDYCRNLNRNWFGQFNLNTLAELVDSHDIIIDIHNSYNCTETFLVDYNQKFKYQIVDDCITCQFHYAIYDNPFTFKHYCDNIKNKYAVTFECKGIDYINEDWFHSFTILDRFFRCIDDGLITYKYDPDYKCQNDELNYQLAVTILNSGEGIFESSICKLWLGKVFKSNQIKSLGNIHDIENYDGKAKEILIAPNFDFRLISSMPVERYYKANQLTILCQLVYDKEGNYYD